MEYLGQGPDNEKIELKQVHDACWLVYCEGNTQSPFEFSSEFNARQFANLLFMECVGELMIDGNSICVTTITTKLLDYP